MNKLKQFITNNPVPKALIVLALIAVSTLAYLNIRTAYQTGDCVNEAGFLWCGSTQQCIQPWEQGCDDIAGGDMDADGCVTSAGYEWCETKQKCVRLWEEVCEDIRGNGEDAHGCVSAEGYLWCESKDKCIRLWEEGCDDIAGGDLDANNCVPSAGYEWCETNKKCFRQWEEECGDIEIDTHGCNTSIGYTWCESRGKCIRPWLEVCVDIYEDDYDEYGCVIGLGYTWCELKNTCVRLWLEDCEEPVEEKKDEYGCVIGLGYEWCEKKEKCLQPWMEECEEVTFKSPENPFPDTDLETLEGEAAAELFSLGIIGGFPDGEFKGDQPVNRAEAAKFLLLAAGIDVQDLDNSNGLFWDVADGEWYVPYVMTAAEEGIINGYDDGSFKPADTVNTAEFLKMLTLAFDLEEGISYTYADVPNDAWFAKYAGTAEFYELFPERDAGLLYSDQELTRTEVAIAIYQYL